jgi:hypothetical protein
MDLDFRHGPGAQHVVEIAAGSTSLNVIYKDASTAHEGRRSIAAKLERETVAFP